MKKLQSERDRLFRQQMTDAIDRQIGEGPVRVERLAAEACMSLTGFRRRFTAVFGEQPQQYVMRYRMERARRMLDDYPELPIIEVANRCGFDDKSNFNRAFRRAFGMAPSQYERGHEEN